MNQRDWTVFRVGLTGGIATGKSTVASMFARRGVAVIDSDQIARALVEPGQPALEQIVELFGSEILGRDQQLDRQRLRQIVFDDPTMRRRLESVLHPRIRDSMLEATRTAGGPYQVLVVPLLVETDFGRQVDRVLVVDCPERLQLARLAARDDGPGPQARQIMATQAARQVRLAAADDVITTDTSLAESETQLGVLHRSYLELAGSA